MTQVSHVRDVEAAIQSSCRHLQARPRDCNGADVRTGNTEAASGQAERLCSDPAGAVQYPYQVGGAAFAFKNWSKRSGLTRDGCLPVFKHQVVFIGQFIVEVAYVFGHVAFYFGLTA